MEDLVWYSLVWIMTTIGNTYEVFTNISGIMLNSINVLSQRSANFLALSFHSILLCYSQVTMGPRAEGGLLGAHVPSPHLNLVLKEQVQRTIQKVDFAALMFAGKKQIWACLAKERF